MESVSTLIKKVKLGQTLYIQIAKEYLLKIRNVLQAKGIEVIFIQELEEKIEEEGPYCQFTLQQYHSLLTELMFLVDNNPIIYYDEKEISKSLREEFEKRMTQYLLERKVDSVKALENREARVQYGQELLKHLDKQSDKDIYDVMDNILELIYLGQTLQSLNHHTIMITRMLESISLFDSVDQWQRQYHAIMEKSDLSQLKFLEKEMSELIEAHWKSFLTNPHDYQNGGYFAFIGHSMRDNNLSGEFHSRYVSGSLFVPGLTDCFHKGVGFLLEPTKIVGAMGEDMGVDNQDVFKSNHYLVLDAPEKVIADCQKRRKECKYWGVTTRIYSEVVVDGFHPIGIFCFTDGSKTLNENYRIACHLKENFPQLDILEIDLTLYEHDSLSLMNALINQIESKLQGTPVEVSTIDAQRYHLFWNQFLTLKKGTYQEEDIISLYLENKRLMQSDMTVKHLLQGQYPTDIIRYVLMKNPLYHIEQTFHAPINMNKFTTLYHQLKDFLPSEANQIIPGLGDFLTVYPHILLNEELERACRMGQVFDFESLNQLLFSQLANQELELSNTISFERSKSEEVEQAYSSKAIIIEKYETSKRIAFHEHFYRLAFKDYETDCSVLEDRQLEKHFLEEKLVTLESKLHSKEQERERLVRFSLFHRLALRRLDCEISNLTNQVRLLSTELETCILSINIISGRIRRNKNYFKEYVDVEFDDYPVALEEAKGVLASTDILAERLSFHSLQKEKDCLTATLQDLHEKLEEIHVLQLKMKRTMDE